MNENNFGLLNKGKYTYINPSLGNYSIIDMTICDPTVYLDLGCKRWHLSNWPLPIPPGKHWTK